MDRFWSKVNKGAPDECWEWTAGKHRQGYGQFRLAGKTLLSHRVVYELTHGELPEGKVVRHKCDNTSCCNPDHLELGTQAQNIRDTCVRKRSRTRLTYEDAQEIRKLIASGMRNADIARKYGVQPPRIWDIKMNKTWREDYYIGHR